MFSFFLTLWGLSLVLTHVHASLDPTEMQQKLAEGQPILGTFNSSGTSMSNWMGSLSDDTTMESINIPGTHDACTWSYTGLLSDSVVTQSQSLFNQLDAGIRFLDLRIGIDGGGVMFYHGDALLSSSVQFSDVTWGLYYFLDAHPTETIVVSIKVDSGDETNSTLQTTLYNEFTTEPTSDYWMLNQTFGTLGEARHKLILFRRYDLNPGYAPVGINVSQEWTDNNADFVISYAPEYQQSAFVEDLYQLNGTDSNARINIKFDATTSHIENASSGTNKTQAFVSFASGSGSGLLDPLTPQLMAVGDSGSGVTGMNTMMLPWLEQRKGQRFGVVLFDFFDSEPGLVAATIGMSVPNTTNGSSTKSGSQPKSTSSALSLVPFDTHFVIVFFFTLVTAFF